MSDEATDRVLLRGNRDGQFIEVFHDQGDQSVSLRIFDANDPEGQRVWLDTDVPDLVAALTNPAFRRGPDDAQPTPGAGGAADVDALERERDNWKFLYENLYGLGRAVAAEERDAADALEEAGHGNAKTLGEGVRDLFKRCVAAERERADLAAERDTLRAMVEKLPHHETCKWWSQGNPALNDCTCGKYAALAAPGRA